MRCVADVQTDYIVPMPPQFGNAHPPSLMQSIVSWMYSRFHPAMLASEAPDVIDLAESDERPNLVDIDMDTRYTDQWIKDEMVRQLSDHVTDWRRSFEAGVLPDAIKYTHTWVEGEIEPQSLM
jgi:hypothetical protein